MRPAKLLLLYFLPVWLVLGGVAPSPAQEILVGGGSGTEANGFSVHAGSIYLAVGQPGVLCGTVKKPGSNREITYLILCKHRATDGSQINHSAQSEASNGAVHEAKLNQVLELHGQKMTYLHEIVYDTATSTSKSEEATINGQKIDLSKGRLILVDFTAGKLTWKQVSAKMPTRLPALDDLDGVRELAKRVQAELPAESKDVQEFLK